MALDIYKYYKKKLISARRRYSRYRFLHLQTGDEKYQDLMTKTQRVIDEAIKELQARGKCLPKRPTNKLYLPPRPPKPQKYRGMIIDDNGEQHLTAFAGTLRTAYKYWIELGVLLMSKNLMTRERFDHLNSQFPENLVKQQDDDRL
jgi:hypothetical protein